MERKRPGYQDQSAPAVAVESLVDKRAEGILFQGRCIAERYHLPEAIGITVDEGNDYTLFSHYLTQRIIRSNVYNSNFMLSRPGISRMAQMPVIGKMIHALDRAEKINREVLELIEAKTQDFIDENYTKEEERRHARTLELAVNDLVARSTIDNGRHSSIVIQKKVTRDWSVRWIGQMLAERVRIENPSPLLGE